MSLEVLVLRSTTVLIILGTIGNGFCDNSQQSVQSVTVPIKQSVAVELHDGESRSLQRIFNKPSRKSNRLRTSGGQLDLDIPFPNPSYTFHRILDYWPYNKIYTADLFSVVDFSIWLVKAARKAFWYLYEFMFIGLKILFQIFDILEMRKSFIALSHDNGGHGWGEDDFNDY